MVSAKGEVKSRLQPIRDIASPVSDPGQSFCPFDFCCDTLGGVYVADLINKAVWYLCDSISECILNVEACPTALAVRECHLWIADINSMVTVFKLNKQKQ